MRCDALRCANSLRFALLWVALRCVASLNPRTPLLVRSFVRSLAITQQPRANDDSVELEKVKSYSSLLPSRLIYSIIVFVVTADPKSRNSSTVSRGGNLLFVMLHSNRDLPRGAGVWGITVGRRADSCD